ncbi:MAG: MBL fold metallo-hydrolase [Alcaligenaceae bacterium]|jgi:glyoxylase-like metal-dependent hydrolase (beta-lactamase superfamily II)|nr:MBL fold metallo-hydrolase [Alcaligenaceae bacterium]
MNENEKKLSYPFDEQLPQEGFAIEVAPGVKWIRLPLPFALDHINCWLIADEFEGQKGWTIVDCGINKPVVREVWERIFEQELKGLPVVRVIVTHMHPDHVGLAGWHCNRWNVPLWMSMTDYFVARSWTLDAAGAGTGGQGAVAHFARHGLLDKNSQQQISERASYYPGLVHPLPASFYRLIDKNKVTIGAHEWQLISGYGHAPEHMSLYCRDLKLLISGDMLLPRISTNVSVFDYEPDANPLPLYLNSVVKFLELPDDTLVLPSHGRPFVGIKERVAQQLAHHEERLQEVMDLCAEPTCAAEVVPKMFKRKLDLHQLTFAMGEALAHLQALYFDGKLSRQKDDLGVLRYQKLN